jgi:hypothetical protein
MRCLSLIAAAVVSAGATPAMAQLQGPCFFLQPDFKGDPMCIAPTQRLPTLGEAVKNKFMSVQIPQGVRVTICEGDNLGGSCQTLSQSVPNFTAIGAAGKVGSLASESAGAPRSAQPVSPPSALAKAAQSAATPGSPPTLPPAPPSPARAAKAPSPAPLAAAPAAPPPPSPAADPAARERNDEVTRELRRQLVSLHKECEGGDKVACIRMGFVIGENRVRRSQWRQDAPELFYWDK